jgi:lipopolysaccharide exporter
MDEKAIRGVPWTLLGYAGTRAITLLTTIALARLLVPADFGLVALATLTIDSLRYFTGLGVAPALVVSPDLDRRARSTGLALMGLLGAVSAVVVAALSPLAADLFDEPRLQTVLMVLSATLLIDGVGAFYQVVMQAELAFRNRFAAMMSHSLTYAVVALTLAAAGAGVWSLVVGQVAAYGVLGVVSFWLSRERVRPNIDRGHARELLARGRGFLIQGGLSFLQQNADYIAVGRILGTAPLGAYSMAFRLSEVPYRALGDPIAQVTFPGFAQMRHRGEDLGNAFLGVVRLVALAACPLGAALAGVADPFTRAVLGDNWLAMIGPLSVLGIWGAIVAVQTMSGWLLNAVGKALEVGLVYGGALALLIPSVIVAAEYGGLTEVAWAILVSDLLVFVALAVLTQRQLQIRVSAQWGALWPVVIGSAGTWAVARVVAEVTADMPSGVGLVLSATAGLGAYAAIISVVAPGSLAFVLQQIRRALGRDQAGTTMAPPHAH